MRVPAFIHSALGDGHDLMAAIRRGDQPAFTALMATYEPLLRGIVDAGLDHQLRSVIDPEDAIQEILITVYRKLPDLDFRGAGAFRRWLEAIAASRLVDLRRRHFCAKRHAHGMRSLEDIAGRSPSGAELNVADQVCASGPSPSSVAAEHEREHSLGSILAQIPLHYRTLIEQVQVQRMSIAEIASASRSKPDAVRKMLSRALQACRTVLAGRGRGERLGELEA